MLASGTSFAAAHLLRVRKTAAIDASAAKVWGLTKNFDGLNTWHPAVATDVIVSGTNNKAGAVRLLTLKGGGTIKEQLISFDAAHRKFRYRILEGVLPVSHYTSTFIVEPRGKNKCTVIWAGWFKRKDLSAHPAAKADDKTAIDTIGGVYTAGLENLKKIAEAK
ncbi:MAG TPA: SRPBCC family protein [Steroidobacteraceae bacterium]|nr:SRPBCC family protein [Steroidobacteraceae bacterium]